MPRAKQKSAAKQDISPRAAAAIIAGLFLLVVYSAYVSGFLPFLKPQSEFGRRVAALADKSGGDFNKLSESEKNYLNRMTSGRGGMALKEYLMSKGK